MREILFRGKRLDNGEWVEGVPFFEEDRCYIIEDLFICDEYACTGAVNFDVIPETVGQYTGLTDKNGKKIFEWDIVKHYNRVDKDGNHLLDDESYVKGLIYFDTSKARYKRTSSPEDVYIGEHCRYEVIGNIHDNPELLEADNG